MIQYVDDELAYSLHLMLKASVDTIYWGNLASVRRFVVGKNRRLELPYFAFYRRVLPHDDKKTYTIPVRSTTGELVYAKYVHSKVQYTVECMLPTVTDQNDVIRNFLIWGGENPTITIEQYLDDPIDLHVAFEEPEDNTDLEAESEIGRLVRTTLTMTVSVPLILHSLEKPSIIYKVLRQINNYFGSQIDEIVDKGLWIEELRVQATVPDTLVLVASEELHPEFNPDSLSIIKGGLAQTVVWSLDSNGILAKFNSDLTEGDEYIILYDSSLTPKIKSLVDGTILPDQYHKYTVEITT